MTPNKWLPLSHAPRLGDVCGGRDNNFNLIRMIAAMAVLVSHAWPIALGTGTAEPLDHLLGRSLGWVAVGIFFAISGFLIARSFDRRTRMADWFAARIMRLFPALLVVLLLTVLFLGPAVTSLSLGQYATHPDTISYVPRNFSLAFLQYDLPGVFTANPYPSAINGSLWTLFHEVACYGGVLVIGLLGLLRRRGVLTLAFSLYLLVFLLSLMPQIEQVLPGRIRAFRDLSLPFAIGTMLYVWRDHIRLSWGLVVLLTIPALGLRLLGWPLFEEVFIIWLSYTVFVLAYLPAGAIRSYNRLGDYSYGLYIYAFPAQQLMMHLFGPMPPWQNIAMALPLTLFAAVLSWILVEKPALGARHHIADLIAPGRA